MSVHQLGLASVIGFFERTLKEAFEVERSERLESGTRVLYYARPK